MSLMKVSSYKRRNLKTGGLVYEYGWGKISNIELLTFFSTFVSW